MRTSLGARLASITALALLGCGQAAVDSAPTPVSAGGAAAPNHCPIGPFGGPMVEIPALDGSRYCIDATEVTNEQWGRFLATSPTQAQWPPLCFDPSFLPPTLAKSWTFEPRDWPLPPDRQQHPVVDIHWCAGSAFCATNGKRLCGRIGGGPLVATEVEGGGHAGDRASDPAVSEWMNACSRGGARPYGYGAAYEPGRCFARGGMSTHPSADTRAVPTLSCEGGFDGLYDLGGSVLEMLAQCWANGTVYVAGCTVGGSIALDETHPGCGAFEGTGFRDRGGDPLIGLRCCADLVDAPDAGQ